jgi:transposase
MKKKSKRYSEQYKRDAVRLLGDRGTRTIPDVAGELGVSQSMLYRWREQYGEEALRATRAPESERAEMESMRRRVRELEAENTFLKKAAALFAKDVK